MASNMVMDGNRRQARASALQVRDKLAQLLAQATGLADLLQAAGESSAEIPHETLAVTAWTIRTALTEAQLLATRIGCAPSTTPKIGD